MRKTYLVFGIPVMVLLILLSNLSCTSMSAENSGKKNPLPSVESKPYLQNYLTRLQNKLKSEENPKLKEATEKILDNALQVQRDIKSQNTWKQKPLVCYIVPAISAVKRLPDLIPPDGKLGNKIRIVAAKGEYIPASFVIFPLVDFSRVEIIASPLLNKDGAVIPSDTVDIKVVKCWYQGGTAWHSYFADPDRRALVPELLLNDETMIKVDNETRDNYLRVDYPSGSEYLWVSYPKEAKGKLNVFNHAKEPVSDSPVLKPIKLTAGVCKQLWITVKVPEDAEPGYYNGTISLVAAGKNLGTLDLNLRVLPFILPEPKTYYDLDKNFYTSIYSHTNINTHGEFLGDDRVAAEKKTLSEMKNLRKHNVFYPLVKKCKLHGNNEIVRRQLELMKEAGLKTDPIFGLLTTYNWGMLFRYLRPGNKIPPGKWKQYEDQIEAEKELVEDVLGHSNIYGIGWDEPGRTTLEAEQKLFELLHDKGLKVYETGKDSHFKYAGFNEDIVNYPGHPFKADSARKWHAMDAKIFSYAGPHTGPENPDFIRRTHGLQLYKADYDGSANYRYYGYRTNIWNDFESGSYRICFVYPTRNGIIDTLHWEAFREGIDDIRYATLLRQLAEKAIAAGGAGKRYAGKKALQYLALLNEHKTDLNTARMEMIHHILKIQNLLKGDN